MSPFWDIVELKDVCRLINGKAYKKSELLQSGPYAVLRVGNFFTNQSWYYSDLELDDDKYCDNDDLLYAWSASFGPRIWKGDRVIFHYHIWKAELDRSRIDKKFLYYWFDWDKEKIKKEQGAGTTMIHVTKESMERRKLQLPPVPEQKRIVAILDEASAGIATAVANTEKNLANARELFQSYLNAVFSQQWEGWGKRRIGDICTLKSGTSIGKKYEKEFGDVAYIKVSDMSFAGNETEIIGSSRFLSNRDIRESSIFPTGTTIFPKRGGAIATNKKRLTSIPICADLNVMGVIPALNLNPKFLFFFFLQIDMGKLGGGSSIPQINNYDIAPLMIAFPTSVEEQSVVVSKLEEIQQETRHLESIYHQKLTSLAELKQSLLQKAFSGELTAGKEVSDAIREAEEVA